ncbi:MAG TPA: hypothetical protein VF544_17815 [Pyrinomonadaceae bacterium]|jgi:hypothetical protein
MRYLGRFCATVALVCVLTASAYAGDIECPAVTSAPPQAAGEIQNDITDVLLIMLSLL